MLNHVQSVAAVLCDVDVIVLNHVQSVAAVLSDVDVIVLNHVQSITAVLPDVKRYYAESRAVCHGSSIRC